MKLLSVDGSIFIFLSYGTLVILIVSGMAAQQSFYFVKHIKTVFVQDLSLYTMQCRCRNCCFVVKAPANAIMQRKQCQLGQKQFWCITKLIAVHPSMSEYEWTMYQMKVVCYHALKLVLFYLFFLRFWEIWSQTWVSYFLTHTRLFLLWLYYFIYI